MVALKPLGDPLGCFVESVLKGKSLEAGRPHRRHQQKHPGGLDQEVDCDLR